MYRILSSDEAARLIQSGETICVNSFVGIENPVELHEAIYRRFHETHEPNNLTIISSAGFGVWDADRCAEGYIREGAVKKLICGHFGAMPSTKRLVLEDRFEAYNLPLGCISHAIRAQASGIPGALSKVGLDIFVDPRREGPGITPEEADRLARLSEKVPVFMSANMSIGVALLCEMAQKAALMFPSADIEIVECHHNKKLDVPSGTALLIARRLTEVREGATVLVGRHENGLRPSGEIGVHSLRMGNEVGRHEVIISTGSETIILRHEAESRSLFAQGALAAARFVAGKEPGLYDMRHLLEKTLKRRKR